MSQLAWTLSQHCLAWLNVIFQIKNLIIYLRFTLNSFLGIFLQIQIPYYFRIRILPLSIHAVSVLFCMLLTTAVIAQDSLEIADDDDSYIDPDRTSDSFQPDKRVESPRTYMFGIGYGLHPIIILAPALSAGMYWDPMVIGVEISDSGHLGIWEKERRENLGPSRLSGETQFLKWFYWENFYLMAAREHRSAKIWSITYNREGEGKAMFDMFLNTTVVSLGTGLLRFNDIGFLAIDILRFSFLQNQSVQINEHGETWSDLSGSRIKLDQNINERSEKWLDWLDSPTGFIVTFGVHF